MAKQSDLTVKKILCDHKVEYLAALTRDLCICDSLSRGQVMRLIELDEKYIASVNKVIGGTLRRNTLEREDLDKEVDPLRDGCVPQPSGEKKKAQAIRAARKKV